MAAGADASRSTSPGGSAAGVPAPASSRVERSDEEWRAQLGPERYAVLRRQATEPAFTGEYTDTEDAGVYRCAGCGAVLFGSDTKFHSGSGWASFWDAAERGAIEERHDSSHGMARTEVVCARCGGHLGHLFPDGPRPTGQRYCVNSLALELEPEDPPSS